MAKIKQNSYVLFFYNDTIMTHCNAGALATVGYGTALGVIRALKENGKMKNCSISGVNLK